MNKILLALVRGLPVSNWDIDDALFEMCDREHAQCNDECLVYLLNGNAPVNSGRPFEENRGCDCFKNGEAMRHFIKTHA